MPTWPRSPVRQVIQMLDQWKKWRPRATSKRCDEHSGLPEGLAPAAVPAPLTGTTVGQRECGPAEVKQRTRRRGGDAPGRCLRFVAVVQRGALKVFDAFAELVASHGTDRSALRRTLLFHGRASSRRPADGSLRSHRAPTRCKSAMTFRRRRDPPFLKQAPCVLLQAKAQMLHPDHHSLWDKHPYWQCADVTKEAANPMRNGRKTRLKNT